MNSYGNSAGNLGDHHSTAGTKTRHVRRYAAVTATVAMVAATLAGTTATATATPPVHHPNAFKQVNLVSDLTTVHAKLVDPAVVNPWGIAMGPATPLWVDNQGTNMVTLYSGANRHDPNITRAGLVVMAESPTGTVFNPTSSFKITQNGVKAPARFLFNETAFDAQGGATAKITGWSNASAPPPPTTTVTKATKPKAFQSGLALVPGESGGHYKRGPRLLAADNIKGVIDVYNNKFTKLNTPHAFVDPHTATDKLPPYNVTFLKGRVYVTYGSFETTGAAVSVFKPDGRFIKRLVSGAPLNLPWGMTIAPEHWGKFGGALLVGNVFDGKINAFNRRNGHFLGTLKDAAGKPLVNIGLWGLAFGNGTIGTPNTLLFAAGIGKTQTDFNTGYEHGLVGLIKPVHDD
jgi:uncharacterized protein (TIGR03118 family)